MITQEASTYTIGSLLKWATERLSSAGFELAEMEARFLMGGFLQATATHIILKSEETLSSSQVAMFQEQVSRRLKHEPAAYIAGTANFMGLNLRVDERVLIPRPETELLVEEAVRTFGAGAKNELRLLDIGTGSGCIAIALGKLLPKSNVLALDNSLGALKVAQVNIRLNELDDRITLLLSDGFEALSAEKTGSFDMIVSNPPYVASTDLSHLEPELSFEPRQALDGGLDGLDVVRRLVDGAKKFLKPDGTLLMEIGHDQGLLVSDLLKTSGYTAVSILKDYGGNDRIAKGTFRGPV